MNTSVTNAASSLIAAGQQPIAVDQTFVPTMSHVFQVPAEWVDDKGSLRMAIQNLAPAAINFDPDDLEIHRVLIF